jgi:mediator of RNA polymerase II transcription subunit 17
MALDFISLLLTREVPRAETTMSPALKNTVPKSSLDFDRSAASQPAKAQEDSDKNIALGWNLTSLSSAADKLLAGAQRLEKEMGIEAKYWGQVLSVSEKGWSTCRMPRERHTVGVRFGFPEAGAQFAARGLAALRPDGDGSIILDQGLTNGAKAIKVRTKRGQDVLSVSQVPSLRTSEDGLEALIEQARDSLFDEELFHEITREARTLLSHDVTFVDDSIHIPLAREFDKGATRTVDFNLQHKIVIELVQRTSVQSHNKDDRSGESDDMALALRMLMSELYRQRFKRRSQPPEPLTDEKYVASISDILRPLMRYLSHIDAMHRLEVTVADVHTVLAKIGMETSLPAICYISGLTTSATNPTSIAASLVGKLKDELHGTIDIALPENVQYTTGVTTQLSNGTGFSFKRDGSITPHAYSGMTISRNMLDFERELYKVLRSDIATWIASKSQNYILNSRTFELVSESAGATESTTFNIVLQKSKLALMRGRLCLALWRADSVYSDRTLLHVLEGLATASK